MKEYHYKNNIIKDTEKAKIQKAKKRASDRIYSNVKAFNDVKTDKGKQIYNERKIEYKTTLAQQEEKYQKGEISFENYIQWINNQK